MSAERVRDSKLQELYVQNNVSIGLDRTEGGVNRFRVGFPLSETDPQPKFCSGCRHEQEVAAGFITRKFKKHGVIVQYDNVLCFKERCSTILAITLDYDYRPVPELTAEEERIFKECIKKEPVDKTQDGIIRKTDTYVGNALTANDVYLVTPSLDSIKAALVGSGESF